MYRFAEAGKLLSGVGGFADQNDDQSPRAKLTLSDDLYGGSCPTFLVGSSGYYSWDSPINGPSCHTVRGASFVMQDAHLSSANGNRLRDRAWSDQSGVGTRLMPKRRSRRKGSTNAEPPRTLTPEERARTDERRTVVEAVHAWADDQQKLHEVAIQRIKDNEQAQRFADIEARHESWRRSDERRAREDT